MSIAPSTGPASSSRPMSWAPTSCCRRRSPIGGRLAPDIRDAFRFHHISTDEVFGSLGAEGLFREDTPYAPNSPYSASKAGSDHLVRAWHPHLRAADRADQLLQQLRPLSLPGEADPADHPQRAGGQAAAGLWQGRERARLAVRRGSRRGAADGGARRARPAKATTSAAAASAATSMSSTRSATWSTNSRPARQRLAARTHHLCHRPPRPRSALRHRLLEDRARTRLAAARDFRDRPAQDGAMVSRQSSRGGRRSAPAPIAASGSACRRTLSQFPRRISRCRSKTPPFPT